MVMALPPKVTEAVAGGLFGGPVGGPCCGVVWADSAAAPRSRLVQIKRRFMESLSLGTNPDRKPQPRPNDCRTGRLSKGRRRGKSRQNECVTLHLPTVYSGRVEISGRTSLCIVSCSYILLACCPSSYHFLWNVASATSCQRQCRLPATARTSRW